ncbi:hypothetical protein GCM10010174_10550 [Kutzneria viridogrisea]|uniref:DUF559 domain-containing protein n=1 Tax=Kutzneria albida DSM 43870 TaxID=1449976 RepID=W5WLA6_9PSEU|nr:hypothetical protein KALB_7984 [Kutzneria albida DSM 43870]
MLAATPPVTLTSFTAAALHGCAAALHVPVHLHVRYDRQIRSRAGLRVHQGDYEDQDVVDVDGLPVFVPERVIAGLICDETRWRALACFDELLSRLSPVRRAAFKADVAHRVRERRDRRGTRRAELLFELASGLPESPSESKLLLTVVDAGLAAPTCQHEVCKLDGTLLYRLDFAWPDAMVALEYDGYAAHEGRDEQDRARDEDLHRRGWLVLRATAEDLREPAALIARLRAALGRRR